MLETVFARKLGSGEVRWVDGWIDEKFAGWCEEICQKVTVMVEWLTSKLVTLRNGKWLPYEDLTGRDLRTWKMCHCWVNARGYYNNYYNICKLCS